MKPVSASRLKKSSHFFPIGRNKTGDCSRPLRRPYRLRHSKTMRASASLPAPWASYWEVKDSFDAVMRRLPTYISHFQGLGSGDRWRILMRTSIRPPLEKGGAQSASHHRQKPRTGLWWGECAPVNLRRESFISECDRNQLATVELRTWRRGQAGSYSLSPRRIEARTANRS